MKFLFQDDMQNLYYLKGLQKWQNLWILQEPSGNYDIINESSSRAWLDFPYKRIEFIGEKYLLTFRNKEKNETYFCVYDENGIIPEIIGENYKIIERYIIINTIEGKELKMCF